MKFADDWIWTTALLRMKATTLPTAPQSLPWPLVSLSAIVYRWQLEDFVVLASRRRRRRPEWLYDANKRITTWWLHRLIRSLSLSLSLSLLVNRDFLLVQAAYVDMRTVVRVIKQ